MAVRHGVHDSDKHFIIDPVTRTIANQSGKLVLIQYDHNSERFTFECPRYVDEHDMSVCDKVEIHFINTGTGNSKSNGIYESKDLQISESDDKLVTFSWLISQNATKHVGKLNFVVRFACTSTELVDGEYVSTIEYAWNTGIYSDIAVSKSIYNGEEFVEDYIDVLESWKQDLYSEGLKIASVEQTTTSTESGGTNIVTMRMTDGSTSVIRIQNGAKGKDGTDGVSVTAFERTSGNGSPGTTDTYVLSLSNGTSSTFKVYNGVDGTDGLLGITQDGIHLNDIATNVTYRLYVQNGDLTMEELADATEPIGAGGLIFTELGTNETYRVYVENGKLVATPTGEVIEGTGVTVSIKKLIVNIAQTDDTYSADHTFNEIVECLSDGGYTYAVYNGTVFSFDHMTSDAVVYCETQTPADSQLELVSFLINSDGVARVVTTLKSNELSDSVTTESSETGASSKAVKIAYDKAVEALNSSGNSTDTNFYAVYGTTTSAEIEEAYQAGKKIYCIKPNGGICPMYERYMATMHCFYRGGFYIYCNNDTWTEDCPYEATTNRITVAKGGITAESTDDKYPSAKAVYDLVAASITGAIEGSY